jgi:phospholipid transport system substrate-binding protein
MPELPAIPARAKVGMLRVLGLALCCAVFLPGARGQDSAAPAAAPAASAEATAGQFDEAAALISRLHETLLSVMQQAGDLGYAGRYRVLEPVITAAFDTPLIVKVILSSHWGELDATQQTDFTQLFRKLSVATYASRFAGFDNETFTEISREALNRGRLLIKTELRRPNNKPVRLDYLMHRAEDGQWRIISVIANGVNDLSLKRAEYAVVIKERGFDALTVDIDRKIKDMEGGVVQADAL